MENLLENQMDDLSVRKKHQLKAIWLENQMDDLSARKKGQLKVIWWENLWEN